jgi:uncharacterized membrane protein YidH (DUF202 family)
MKKGLTMLVTAMVAIAMIAFSGVALASEAPTVQPQGSVAASIVLFSVMVMAIGIALYLAMRQKKSRTITRPGRSAKALSTAVVLALIVVNAQHTLRVDRRGKFMPSIDERQ